MGFFTKLKSSIYKPSFYSKIKTQSLGESLKYFFLLAIFLTLINTLILSYELAVKVPREIKNFVSQTVNSFPSDLAVTIDDGQVSTTTEEPLFVPFPSSDDEINQQDFNNILVIDTKTPYSAAQFGQYKTLFWLTRDSLFYQNQEFDARSIDLTKVENMKIDRQFVGNLVEKINPWLGLIGPALIVLVSVGMYLGFTFNLIYLLFLAVLIFFLGSIFKWGLTYSASYKTAIYASTLAFLVDLVLFNTGIYTGFYGFPFLFTLIALCITTINLQNQDKSG